MSIGTSIEWTEATWNPVTGCTKVSPGCARCYIERTPPFRINGRKFRKGDIPLIFHDGRLTQPLHWKRPRRVFVNSLSDLFHEDIPFVFIKRVWDVMAEARQHTFQVLTKRPERLLAFTRWMAGADDISAAEWPRNVWLGVSCENQRMAELRVPVLCQVPCAIRWVSAEPLLGPIDFSFAIRRPGEVMPALARLDWIVVGGESGPNPRRFDIQWARDIIVQCRTAGVWCFIKQLGANADNSAQPDGSLIQAALTDNKGGNPLEWPEDLRVRQYPHEGATA